MTEALPTEEERRFQRGIRPSIWRRIEIWFWVSPIPAVILCVILGLCLALAGGWIRWKLLTELGWI